MCSTSQTPSSHPKQHSLTLQRAESPDATDHPAESILFISISVAVEVAVWQLEVMLQEATRLEAIAIGLECIPIRLEAVGGHYC